MVYGLVSGSSIRSYSVRIASVFGFLVCSGSESNSSRGATAIAERRKGGERDQDRPRDGARRSGSNGASQAKPTTAASPRRPAQRDRRRQEAERADEGDQHADAGDQAELRHAGEVRRHEGEEAGRRGHRGDQDLVARCARRSGASPRRVGILEAALAVAHRELDGEIHRDADEQDAEADRHQVERADRDGGEQQGQHQAEPERRQDRHDQPPGLHREEQPQRDQHHAADQTDHRALHDGGEFLVRQRHLAGDPHTRLARLHELQPGDDLRASPRSPRRRAAARRNPASAAPARTCTCRRDRSGRRRAASARTAGADGRPARPPSTGGSHRASRDRG